MPETAAQLRKEITQLKRELRSQKVEFEKKDQYKLNRAQVEEYQAYLQGLLEKRPSSPRPRPKTTKGKLDREQFLVDLPKNVSHYNVAYEIYKMGLASSRPQQVSQTEAKFSGMIPKWGLGDVFFIQANNGSLAINGLPTSEFLKDAASYKERIKKDLAQAVTGAKKFVDEQVKPSPRQPPAATQPQLSELAERLARVEDRLEELAKAKPEEARPQSEQAGILQGMLLGAVIILAALIIAAALGAF